MNNIKIIFIFIFQISLSQNKSIELSSLLSEVSGIEINKISKNLLLINDSNNTSTVFEIDKENGEIINKYNYPFKNKDWEDLASDNKYYFISDSGNSRKNKNIINIYILDLKFEFIGELKISLGESNKNYDFEALTNYKNELLLFTKNDSKKPSRIYRISKTSREQILNNFNEINISFKIASADYDEKNDILYIAGYDSNKLPKINYWENFSYNQFINSPLEIKITDEIFQLEGIKTYENVIYLVSEKTKKNKPLLIKITQEHE